jgi:tetratricopeptide (TPR) repeat protein
LPPKHAATKPRLIPIRWIFIFRVSPAPTPLENLTHALGFFERALALDSGNVEALVGLASANATIGNAFLSDDRAERLAKAEADATKALFLAPDHGVGCLVIGSTQIPTNRMMQGIAECNRALALNPNLAAADVGIALGKLLIGRDEEIEGHVMEALRLSPRETLDYIWVCLVGGAQIRLGRDEQALPWLRRGIEINRNYHLLHLGIAAALANLDQIAEAPA